MGKESNGKERIGNMRPNIKWPIPNKVLEVDFDLSTTSYLNAYIAMTHQFKDLQKYSVA